MISRQRLRSIMRETQLLEFFEHLGLFKLLSLSIILLCEVFSRLDFFSKKECTGRTRLMRRAIYTENPSKDSAFAIAAGVTSAPLNILATSITLSLPLTRLMEVTALSPENSLVTT